MQELLTWGSAIAVLIGFGLTMGANPALYGATADMLARKVRPLPRLSWMVGGLVLGATILYVVFQSFNPTSFVNVLRHKLDSALLSRAVDLGLGVCFLLLALIMLVWVLRVRTLPERPAKAPKQHAHMSGYFVIGFGSSFIGFTPLPILYLTGRITTNLSPDWAPRLIAFAVFLVALGGPFFLLAWLWQRFPTLTERITGFYQRAQHWDYRLLSAAIFMLAGVAAIIFAFLPHQ